MMQIKADGRTVYVKVKVLQENYSFGVGFFFLLFVLFLFGGFSHTGKASQLFLRFNVVFFFFLS